jgi:L-fucose isomerase-like protein
MSRLKIGYVGSHLPSYFAHEYNVFGRSAEGLEKLAAELGFDLHVISEPVVSAEDARKARGELEAAGVDFMLLQNSTFAMGDVVTQFAASKMRLGLWAVEEPTNDGAVLLNNFVSLNLNAGILRRYFKPPIPYKWFFGFPEHAWFRSRLTVTVQALSALKSLGKARIGLVGGIAPTFYNFVFDERKLSAKLGVQVVAHELVELFELAQRSEADTRPVVQGMINFVRGRVEVSPEHMHLSAAVYLAMRDLAYRHGYDALAVSDWPEFQRVLGIHPGMAFSWFDEADEIPVAAEGDVLGAVSMLMLRRLSGRGALLLDFSDLDPDKEAILAWHCGGSPLDLANATGVTWKNHSTLGRKNPDAKPHGAVADFNFAHGSVTITRVCNDCDQLLVASGEVMEGKSKGFEGSRGWVNNLHINHQPIKLADFVNTMMVEGLEHHFILGSGLHTEALSEVAAWSGMRPVPAVPYQNFMQVGS